MQASIQPDFTWSKEHIFAGRVQSIILLVEWRGAPTSEQGRKRNNKLAAREIELRLWLEPHIVLTKLHGCHKVGGEDRSLLLPLGKIQSGQRKYIAFEFRLDPVSVGIHDAIWMQWQYKQPYGERICELPMQKLSLEYSLHTGFLYESTSFYVEKHLELLRTEEILEEAESLRSKGKPLDALELVRRHADKLLILAVRSGDRLLTREAENLYRRSEIQSLTFDDRVISPDLKTECI